MNSPKLVCGSVEYTSICCRVVYKTFPKLFVYQKTYEMFSLYDCYPIMHMVVYRFFRQLSFFYNEYTCDMHLPTMQYKL